MSTEQKPSRREFIKKTLDVAAATAAGAAALGSGIALAKLASMPDLSAEAAKSPQKQEVDPLAREFVDKVELLGDGRESIDTPITDMGTPNQSLDSILYVTSSGENLQGKNPPPQGSYFYNDGKRADGYFGGANISMQVRKSETLKFYDQPVPMTNPEYGQNVGRVAYLIIGLDNATQNADNPAMVVAKATFRVDDQVKTFEGEDAQKLEKSGMAVYVPIVDHRLDAHPQRPKNIFDKLIMDVKEIEVELEGTKGEKVNFKASRTKPS